jgi:predicted RNA-binding Zn-ribbon protein involved in translation (DUF1610 family)
MKAKAARRRRRARHPKVNNVHKMVGAPNPADSQPPYRIFYDKTDDGNEAVMLANKTDIVATGTGTDKASALFSAVESYYTSMVDQPEPVSGAEPVADNNPLHHVCPKCGAGLNEKCFSTRTQVEAKNFHVDRTRLAQASVA